jgi:hypothetical protein
MSTSMSTVIPISTGISTAKITGQIWKHVGKAGEAPGSMTPVTAGASRIEIKGRRSASTEAAMREPRRHERLSVAGRRVGDKSWGVVV